LFVILFENVPTTYIVITFIYDIYIYTKINNNIHLDLFIGSKNL